MNTNGMTNSDEMAWMDHITPSSFWSDHLPRGLGYVPPAEPEPAPKSENGPDVGAMSLEEYASYRADHNIDSGDFIGVHPWSRSSVRDRAN